ncbi:hypothetical protein P1J78_08835 [Psychromarinibacter sp. C21-152]|uniref:DUF3299 domain-containing protein n=1 Tax=Psychromarinibacter sediminicola TaxID=3033385 RepID=A0AAE3T9A8_9RHOB|nr:hypothetical protein [Psychromarinibacter sediminicola]MDF0600834.1 hypothetical protein [Psychromarinibacter sediminicola]
MLSRRTFLTTAAALPLAAPALAQDGPIKLRELYNRDQSFSDLAQTMEGQRVTVEGYMAPPLKAETNFFVLTKMPMAVCPFCETEAEWPDDILAIYAKRTIDVIPFNVNIETRGVLELGTFKDPETGFVSRVRLTDATYYET